MKAIQINDKLLSILKNIVVFVLLAAEVAFLAFFLLGGVASAFGQTVNAFTVIHLVFSITYAGASSFYKIAFGTALGVLYIVYIVMIIKAIVSTIRYIKNSLNPISINGVAEYAIQRIYDNFGNCFFYIISYMIFARMVGFYTISSNVIACLIVGLIVSLIAKVVIELIRCNDLLSAAYSQIGCYGILLASIILFLVNICTTSFHTTFNVFSSSFATLQYAEGAANWVSLLDKFGVNNVLLIIIQIFTISVLRELLTYPHHAMGVTSSSVRKLFIFSAITFGSHILLVAIYTNEVGFDMTPAVINAAMKYLPIVIYSAIAWFTFKFPIALDSAMKVMADKENAEERQNEEKAAENATNGESDNETTEEPTETNV